MLPEPSFAQHGRSYFVYLGPVCIGFLEPKFTPGSRSVNAYRAFRKLSDGGFAEHPVIVADIMWQPTRKDAARALVARLRDYAYGRALLARAEA